MYSEFEHELAAVFCEGEGATDHGGDRIGEKPTAEANKHMAEVLKQQRSIRKRSQATAHTEEAQTKIGKYGSISGTASARRHFKKELGDLLESTVRKYKQLYEKELSVRATRDNFSDITALPPKQRG